MSPGVWTLTESEAAALAAAAPGSRLIDLAHPLRSSTSHYPTHVGFELTVGRRHGDRVRGDLSSSASCHFSMGTHTGTHLDALGHVSQDGILYDGSPARENTAEDGLLSGGIEQTRPFLGRAVLVDLTDSGTPILPADHEVTRAELASALAPIGLSALNGAALVMRTGWEQHWETPQYVGSPTVPGPGVDAARFMADHGALLVGSDTATFEPGPMAESAPVHTELIVRRRIQIMENLKLSELAAQAATGPACRAVVFTLIVVPLPIQGGSGSPVRPLALVST